jgi:peroxiredoxin
MWKLIGGLFVMTLTFAAVAGEADAEASLEQVLRERSEEFAAAAPAEMIALFERGIQEVGGSGVLERALAVGDEAPAFTLPGATGSEVALSGLLEHGPVVIVFYRGGWCPYCNIQLQHMQRLLPAFEAAGATLVAISPERPDHTLDTAEREALSFEVLSDTKNEVARAFGVVYPLPAYLVEVFRPRMDLAARHDDDKWELPLAATYVVDRAGIIQYAFVDSDYRKRAEPAAVLAAVEALADDSARK